MLIIPLVGVQCCEPAHCRGESCVLSLVVHVIAVVCVWQAGSGIVPGFRAGFALGSVRREKTRNYGIAVLNTFVPALVHKHLLKPRFADAVHFRGVSKPNTALLVLQAGDELVNIELKLVHATCHAFTQCYTNHTAGYCNTVILGPTLTSNPNTLAVFAQFTQRCGGSADGR